MEPLRALMSINGWEFCILWKLSKDFRFLELMDCCCTGAEIYPAELGFDVSRCRDVFVPHFRTKACDLLAKFPSFIHINNSRVYAETLFSNQTTCIHLFDNPNSDDIKTEIATRLFIPVQGGLVELFATTARQVSESQVLINYITENFNFPLDFINHLHHSNIEDDVFSRMFSTSINDHNQKHDDDDKLFRNVEMDRFDMISEDESDVKIKCLKKNGKELQSKNLIAERRRRKKLNERLYMLRSLVPTISKLDRASILGDAIDFIKELEKQKKDLEQQLQQQSDNEYQNSNCQHHEDTATDQFLKQTKVEVKMINESNNVLFVKMLSEKKACGFLKVLEVLEHQDLEIVNVNVNTFGTLVSSVFQVQGKDGNWEIVEVDCVKERLLEITM